MKFDLVKSAKSTSKVVGAYLKEHAPEIGAVMGAGFIIGGTILACKKTLELEDIMDERKEEISKTKEIKEESDTKQEFDYPDKAYKKDITVIYAKTVFDVVKLYSIPAGMITFGLGCMFASNGELRKRNAALASACASWEAGFKKYRERVVEKYGEEVDHQLIYGSHTETVEETVVDENGNEKKVKTKAEVCEEVASPFCFYFKEGNPCWSGYDDANETLLNAQEGFANDRLWAEDVVSFMDILKSVGLDYKLTPEERLYYMSYCYKNNPDTPIGIHQIKFNHRKVYLKDGDNMEKAWALEFTPVKLKNNE